MTPPVNPERQRLLEARSGTHWRKWGPYLSERQWGTVREDYSPNGTAWDSFPHDHARSRAYRWGEDGIGGFSDDRQMICLSLALWNGRDAILKERLFGLTNSEANHGEDVKELYYYLDGTPTHSYMRMLYKYPQAAFPYARLVEENGRRSKQDLEYELLDTGLFDEDRYFDVEIEYAKDGADDILMRVTAQNRGPEAAEIHLLPHVWFRNTWSWRPESPRPQLSLIEPSALRLDHPELGAYRIAFDGSPRTYFCENETNVRRLYGLDAAGPFKDAIHERVVGGADQATRSDGRGTKMAAHYTQLVEAHGSVTVCMRLAAGETTPVVSAAAAIFTKRREEADAFYAELQEDVASEDERRVQRQALAGMLWSKQVFIYDVRKWLEGDPAQPAPPPERKQGRNAGWKHFDAADVLSMPDKWEYPWFAAWDLAFHCVPLAMIDADFAKRQLMLLTREGYMHPNGQLPAYEWAFGDVNPPVHAWSAWRVFQADRGQRGDEGDLRFLETVFIKLLLNFTWWVNRKDAQGSNVFQGGFLGLDNIGVFDRSAPLPTGGLLDQSDGTSWMAMYSLNMMRIALELATHDAVYEDIATKFFEHFLQIAEAMEQIGGDGLWDDEDQFYYDWLDMPDRAGRRKIPLRVRSMVGLIPLYAVEVLDPALLARLPKFRKRLEWYLEYRPDLAALVASWHVPNAGDRRLLSLLGGQRLEAILRRMLDEEEFLSPHGIRALSRFHRDHPFRFDAGGQSYGVDYAPGESQTGLFGGNSNWRGPVWMPVNFLIVEALHKFHHYHGEDFTIEFPTGSGNRLNLLQIADEISRRLTGLFIRGEDDRRAIFGASEKQQRDPHFRDHILFYEYFHGDDGRGIGASHQTGWTGLVAKLIQPAGPPDLTHVASGGERD